MSPYYDPQLAKVIVTADDRPMAVRKLQVALREFEIGGIATNIPFLRRLVEHPDFVTGKVTTAFVPSFLAQYPS